MTPAAESAIGQHLWELAEYRSTTRAIRRSAPTSAEPDRPARRLQGERADRSRAAGSDGWNHFFTTVVAPTAQSPPMFNWRPTRPAARTAARLLRHHPVRPGRGGSITLNVSSINNSGSITIGPTNKINVSGGFTQTSTGTLDVQLGSASTGSYGSMTITGTAVVGGTLKAEAVQRLRRHRRVDSFTPIDLLQRDRQFFDLHHAPRHGLPVCRSGELHQRAHQRRARLPPIPPHQRAAPVGSRHANLLGINATWWDQAAVDIADAAKWHRRGAGRLLSGDRRRTSPFNYVKTESHGVPWRSLSRNSPSSSPPLAELAAWSRWTTGRAARRKPPAELAYSIGSPSDTTVIGNGLEWNDTTSAWQTVNWQTAGYWASLRAAAPLPHDDGLNFLRIGHPAPFSTITYWEVGNEEYGSWEVDHHGTAGPGGASTGVQHDPATYVAFAQQFAALAASIITAAGLPGISIGIDSGDPTGGSDNNWTKNVLTIGLTDGFMPGFISDHSYMQAPGSGTIRSCSTARSPMPIAISIGRRATASTRPCSSRRSAARPRRSRCSPRSSIRSTLIRASKRRAWQTDCSSPIRWAAS